MPTYICKEHEDRGEATNAFWKYELEGNTGVTIRFGRIGLKGQEAKKSFDSQSARDKYVNDKIREKTRHGYQLSNEETLAKETQTAKELGTQYKIRRIQWVARKGSKLNFILNYEPTQWVYVEILNSWKGDVTRLILSKTESLQIEGTAESNRVIEFDSVQSAPSDFAKAVRNYLRSLAKKVVAVAQKFAAMGNRALDLGFGDSDDEEPTQQAADLYEQVAESGATAQVISKFGGLGERMLEL